MIKRLLHMFLFITASMAIIILIVSPSFLFNGEYTRDFRHLCVLQNISPQRLYLVCWRNIKTSYVDPTMNNQDWNRWKYRYLKHIKTDEDVYVAVNTMLASLNDEYSEFYNSKKYGLQEQYIRENTDTESHTKAKGARVQLEVIAGMVYSAKIVSSSKYFENPKEGDILVSINNYPICGLEMNSAIKLIHGVTNVSKAEIIRNNKLMTFPLTRGSMDVNKLSSKYIDGNINYISVYSLMGNKVPVTFGYYLNNDNNVKGYIIDLRGDVGGLFLNAIYIADKFIEKGNLITIEYRTGETIAVNAQPGENKPKKPVVILVNNKTASSSEILAGTMRKNNRAILVGEPTYGKNRIQQIIPLPNKTCINLTTAKYKFGDDFDKENGIIIPDYNVKITYKDIIKGNDTQLNKAISIINSMQER